VKSEPYIVGRASNIFTDFMRPSRYKALYGGRGSAKSHFFGEALIANANANEGFRAVCVREIQKSLKESAKRLLEDKIKSMGVGSRFDVQRDQIITPGGGVIIFEGMNDHTAETIKSLEGFQVCWVEEAQTLSSKSLEMLRPTIRAPGSELWFSWNPRSKSDPVDAFFRGPMPPENAIIAQINYTDNELFPKELEQDRMHDHKSNPDRYAHIWLGAYEPEALGAIWTRQVIDDYRLTEAPPLDRIVVGVDPAVTNTDVSDTHGIVVCALGADGHGYVLEDASLKGSPHQWAQRALAMYDKWDADAIVIEVNQGGDMVRHTIESTGRGARIVEVRATRGKHVRAEPISAIYSTGRVHHVGSFPELEDQLVKFTAHGYEGEDSPDRADAMIWGMTELFPRITMTKSEPEEYYPQGGSGSWMG
jgi:phage terminase large subunit-like protein